MSSSRPAAAALGQRLWILRTSATTALAVLLLSPPPAPADDLAMPWDHVFAVENQLQNSICGVIQDAKGYIWFASGNKLYKHDGYGFKTFTHDPEDRFSISDGQISDMLIDATGLIWLGTRQGQVDRLDPVAGRCYHYALTSTFDNGRGTIPVEDLYLDRDGVLWASTSGAGLHRFDGGLNSFEVIDDIKANPFSLAECTVLQALEDSSGKFWLSVKGIGLVAIDKKSGECLPVGRGNSVILEVPARRDAHMLEDSAGNLWVWAWGGGLYKVEREDGTLHPFALQRRDEEEVDLGFVTCLREDRSGCI